MLRILINKVPIGTITSGFGDIDSAHSRPHTGYDLSCNLGDHIYTPLDGIVSKIVHQSSGLGNGLFIKLHNGKQMIFGHFSELNSNLYVGKVVHKGDYLGNCGSSGNSTAPHLHIGSIDEQGRFIDPSELFKDIASSVIELLDHII